MRIATLTVSAVLLAAPSVAQHQAAQPSLVLHEAVQGMPRGERQEVRVLTPVVAPGTSSVLHTHPFPAPLYVLEGGITVEAEGAGLTACARARRP